MIQKEEKIVGVLLVMAVLSLIIGYFGFVPTLAAYSSESKIGERVFVEGTILSKDNTSKGNHLILKISNLDIPDINVFISKDNGAKEVYGAVEKGDRVRIEGKIAEYMNAREIVVESAKDVKKL
jgi:DNA/RNA endonuclease YhcR with UshA esterase domain